MMTRMKGKNGVPILAQMLCICFAAVCIVSIGIPFYLLPLFEQELYASKKEEIRTLVQTAHSIVNVYYQRSVSGELSEKRAKELALERVGSMRYAKSGYFWVNDLTPVMLMHPIEQGLNGKPLKDYRDAAGDLIFDQFAAICRNEGEGFVPYRWPEPGSPLSVKKLSFVKSFQPWGWVIGTGVYDTEVRRAIDHLHLRLVIGTAAIILLLAVASFWIAHHITLPLRHLAQFAGGIGEDLTCAAPVEGSRETRELATALNGTIERLSTTLVSRDRLDAAFSFTRTILDAIPMGILIFNAADKTIVDVNEWLVRDWGEPKERIVGGKCHHYYWGCEEVCQDCPVDHCLLTGKTVIEEVGRIGSDGKERFFQAVVAPVQSCHGVVTQVVHVSQDITARKEIETALAEKNRELAQALESLASMQSCVIQTEKLASIGQIAAGVAHEINNPVGFVKSNISAIDRYLSKLVGYIGMLEESHQLREEVARRRRELKIDYVLNDIPEIITESLGGIERIEGIVRNLKSFSRLDSSQMAEADLNACLDTTISIIWNEIKYKAELVKQYGELPQVTCFAQQMNQVFMNLLVNAAHAIETAGTITVTTWADATQVHVSVADTGSGIPPEICDRIFEPFFTTKPAGKGTGLGLSISYDIVKKHGGEITVRSVPGKGTEFVVSVPLRAPLAEAPETPEDTLPVGVAV
ncbi:MAG TPA: hypothetical protein DCZ75_13235 [Geobacter sp.]|nr:hypothetical protein [Geobacter sp.]